MMRVPFPCSRNRLRSPTAEQCFSNRAGLDVASAGLNADSDVPCTPELLEWADIIFVMEKAHRSRLNRRYARHLRRARIVCLDIPDNYAFMAPALVKLLEARVGRHLPLGIQQPR